jgi:hypothetical protein
VKSYLSWTRKKVKHEVADPQAQGRTHPYYESLMEQKGLFVNAISNQGRRNMVVLPLESTQAIALRTLTEPTTRWSAGSPPSGNRRVNTFMYDFSV